MEHEFMVTYKVYNKILKVKEKTFAAIIEALNRKLDAAEKTAKDKVIFRIYSEKYKRHTDCDEESDLPDDGILEIIEKPKLVEPVRQEREDDSENVEETGNDGDGEGNSDGNDSSRDEEETNDTPESELLIPSLVAKPNGFPKAYRLPTRLPPKVLMVLTRGKTPQERTESQKIVRDTRKLRNQLMRCIKNQLDTYTDYPNGALLTVVTTLIQKYPGLADEVPQCADSRMSYIRHKTMLSCLKNKFKYYRKTEDEPTPLMLAIRKKYGRKGKAQSDQQNGSSDAGTGDEGNGNDVGNQMDPDEADNAAPRKTYQREHLKLPPNAGVGETDATYEKHIEFIRKSWNSRNPDLDGIASRMDKSIVQRIDCYDQGPEQLLAKFPNLENAYQIIQDAKRYFDFDFSERRANFFSDDTIKFLFTKVSKIPAVSRNRTAPDDDAPLSQKLDYIFNNVQYLCNETSKVIKPYRENNVGVHPCLCYETHEDELSYKVFIDKKLICSSAPDLPTAVDVLMALIYLFNIDFGNRNKRTFRFLAEEVYCIPFMTAKAQSAVTLMNQLVSYRLSSKSAPEVAQDAEEDEG